MDIHVQQLSSGEEEEIDSTIKDKGKGKNQKNSSDKPHVILIGKKRQRRLSSSVWVHFEFLDEPDENGNLICKCKKCGLRFNADSKNGTRNLHRHLKNCKRRSFRDVGQMILEKTSSSLGNRLPDFDADYFCELFSLAIVEHDMPFQFVEFKGCSTGLYEAYDSSYSLSSKAIPTTNASDAANEACDDYMTDFDSFSMEQSSVAIKSEIDMYYEEPLIHRGTNLDILSYWRTCSVRYPTLAKIAKDLLAVPISTMDSESTFITGSRVLDCYRSSLKSETVEAIICLGDWDFGEANMDPEMEMLCGSVMKLKVGDNDDTPHTSPELKHLDESPNASSNIV
uniref:BED-type domain-containing protein n=1 Tax=Chenopodium quinoa TaxID=63459 RepID=A0A803M124_CHEQI